MSQDSGKETQKVNNNQIKNNYIDPKADISGMLFGKENDVLKEKGFKFEQERSNTTERQEDKSKEELKQTISQMALAKDTSQKNLLNQISTSKTGLFPENPIPSRTERFKKNKSSIYGFYISIFLLVFISGIALGYKYYYMRSDQNIVQTEWGTATLDVPQSKDMVNVMLMGFDKGGYRTDTMMIINFNPQTSAVNLISIPRDTLVGVNGKRMKLNAVFAIGKFDMLLTAIRQLTGLPIHYFIAVDTSGFKSIIDTLGGVQFDVPKDMKYYDPVQGLNIDLKKGPQLLDGDKAEQLVRYRKYIMGDLEREDVQKNFIKALIEQKLTLASVSDVPKMRTVYNEITTYVKTNLGFNDLMKYVVAALKINGENFKTYTLPGVPKYINGVSYFVYDKKATVDLYSQIIGGEVETKFDLSKGIDIYDIESMAIKTENGTKTGKEDGTSTNTNNNPPKEDNQTIEKIEINDGKDVEYTDTGEVKPIEHQSGNQEDNTTEGTKTDESSISTPNAYQNQMGENLEQGN